MKADHKKHVEMVDGLIKDSLTDIEMKQRAKKRELEDIGAEFERTKREKRIKLEQDFQQYGMEQVKTFLDDKKQIPVPREDYEKLQADLQKLKESQQVNIEGAVAEVTTRYHDDLERTKTTLDLKHQAEVAAKDAQIKQLMDQCKILDRVIEQQRHDLDEQRKVTIQVSGASRLSVGGHGSSSGSSGGGGGNGFGASGSRRD